MYVADQSSKSRSRSGVLNKEKTSGEFTLNPDPITIYRQSAVFEPNPSQQGLKPQPNASRDRHPERL